MVCAYAQLVRKGAPFVLGNFLSSMSLKSGAPTFGMPEPVMSNYAIGQLARRLGLPLRCGGSLTASKIEDAQAAYESAHTLTPTVLGGVNFALHSAGWMEGGLVADYAKLILDADQLMMIPKLVDGIDVSEQAQAMDALRETGPGQHFLGSAHTQANFEDAFWRSEMADNTTYEQWSSEGSIDSAGRARKNFADMLESYVAPEIDQAVDEALRGLIAKRMEELPDADY